MMLVVLAAVLAATDAAVIALFLVRRRIRPAPAAAAPACEPAREIEAQLSLLRLHAEQASAELARQQLQLRRLLNGRPEPVARIAESHGSGALTDLVRLVRDGLPPHTAAARMGTSIEEAHLARAVLARAILSIDEPRATA